MTLQMDVFWVYAIGAMFAAVAARQIQASDRAFYESRYFAATILYLTVFFTPTAAYLLWQFPAWETMHVWDAQAEIGALIPAIQAFYVVVLGVLGYYVSYWLIRNRSMVAAHVNWILGYFGFFYLMVYGWDSYGWQRFLYVPGQHAGEAWGVGQYDVVGFLTSDLLLTLLVMAVYVLPPQFYLLNKWFVDGAREHSTLPADRVPDSYVTNTVIVLVGIFGLAFGGALAAGIAGMLVASATGSAIAGIVVGVPLVVVPIYYLGVGRGRPVHTLITFVIPEERV